MPFGCNKPPSGILLYPAKPVALNFFSVQPPNLSSSSESLLSLQPEFKRHNIPTMIAQVEVLIKTIFFMDPILYQCFS